MKKIPNPGSLKARQLGCTCPVLDNEFGSAEDTGGMFIIAANCSLHKEWYERKTNTSE